MLQHLVREDLSRLAHHTPQSEGVARETIPKLPVLSIVVAASVGGSVPQSELWCARLFLGSIRGGGIALRILSLEGGEEVFSLDIHSGGRICP